MSSCRLETWGGPHLQLPPKGNGSSISAYIFGRASEEYEQDFMRNLHIYSAWEIDEDKRKVLLGHRKESKPQHVFGDILDMVPDEERAKCQAVMDDVMTRFKELKKQYTGDQMKIPAISMQEFNGKKVALTEELLQSLDEILEQVTFKENAYCFKCQHDCPISPRSCPRHRMARWIEVGGHTCDPWTAMGSGGGFCDNATLPAMVWMHAARYFEPDDILMECTPCFDPEPFLQILNQTEQLAADSQSIAMPKHPLSRPTVSLEDCSNRKYSMFVHRYSPIDLGFPTSRRRVYAWFRLDGIVDLKIDEMSMRVMFEDVFFNNINCDASIFFRPDIVDETVMRSHQIAWATKREED